MPPLSPVGGSWTGPREEERESVQKRAQESRSFGIRKVARSLKVLCVLLSMIVLTDQATMSYRFY